MYGGAFHSVSCLEADAAGILVRLLAMLPLLPA
jgi:hypothetical protein